MLRPADCRAVTFELRRRFAGALALAALFTLDGVFRYGVWVVLGGFAAKTFIAHKAGW